MLAPLGDVRPGERRGATAAFLTIFGILAGHTLLETARDALFLARLPPSELPGVYLVMAVVAIALFQGPWRAPRVGGRYGLSLVLVSAGMATFVFWAVLSSRNPWALRALYVWTGILGTMAALQFWIVLGEIYTVTQAKRIYSLVATGSVLGAIAGAAVARAMTQVWPPRHLILAGAVVLVLTGLGPAMRVRRPVTAGAAGHAASSILQTARLFRNDPYIKALGGLVLVSTVALTLADYVFKSTVAQTVEPARLGTFFATFYMVLNVLALVAQLALAGWLLRVLGLHRTLWVLPALVCLGAAGVALGGGLVAALLLKGADGTFRSSLHRTGTELLFVPLKDSLRARAKPVIDVVGQRGGQALASLLILAEITQNRGNTLIAAAAAALCVVWIAWVAELKSHYLDLFRSALREGALRARGDLPALDLGSLEALFTALNSRDDSEVIGAMELLAAGGRARLIPALILFHPSREVVIRALAAFTAAGRNDFVSVADRLLGHDDASVRAAALRARTAVRPDEALLRRAFADPDPLVSATALVGLVSGGWMGAEARAAGEELVGSPSPDGRRALAAAVRAQPAPMAVFEPLLLRLADDPDEDVQAEVAMAMGALRLPSFVPALLPMLASSRLRPVARAALVGFGEPALDALEDALRDHDLPHEIRSHVPRTISRFPAEQAGPRLLAQLVLEEGGMVRYKILRGLGRLAAENPQMAMDRAVLRSATERTLEALFRLVHWRTVLSQGAEEDPRRATPGHELLVALLRDKEAHALERLFRLLGLQHRAEDFEKIYRGVRHSSAKVRAGSRELLENLVQPPLREAILAIVDEVPDTERLARAAAVYRALPMSYDDLLARLIEEPGETVRCLAVYHVGELGLTALSPRLEAVRADRGAGLFLLRVVERALGLLARAPGRLQYAG